MTRDTSRYGTPGLWLRVTLLCGGLPLTAGVSSFAIWTIIRGAWGITAGVTILYGGLGLFTAGLFFLMQYVWLARRDRTTDRQRIRNNALLAGGLLLVNFPAAAGIFSAGVMILTRYEVTVVNAGPEIIDSIVLSGGGVNEDFGPIPPGHRKKRGFWIQHDGTLPITAKQGNRSLMGTVDGYVTYDMCGHKIVIFTPEGKIRIEDSGCPDRPRQ